MYEAAPAERSSRAARTGAPSLDDAGFSYEIAHDSGGVVVAMRGELDLASAPELQRELLALLSRPVASVTLDLGDLTFLDSSGLGALNHTRQAAVEQGVPFRLEAVPEHVIRLLDVTAMAPLFDLDAGRP